MDSDAARTLLLLVCCGAAATLHEWRPRTTRMWKWITEEDNRKRNDNRECLAHYCDVFLILFLANSYIACLLCYPG